MEPESAAAGERARRTIAPLLRAAVAGDPSALASLYDQTAPRVFGFLRTLLGAPGAAEETLVEVYLALPRDGRGCPEGFDALAWLLLRARQIALARGAASLEPVQFPAAGASAALDADERTALGWAFLRGLGEREIAERLRIPPARVRQLVRAGIQKVQGSVATNERVASSLRGASQ
jgi:DNA-directed RNA polymerase specialized sigma24 family protein